MKLLVVSCIFLVFIISQPISVFSMPKALLRELQENFGIFSDRHEETDLRGAKPTLEDDRDERNREIEELRKLMREISRLAQHKFFNQGSRGNKTNAYDAAGRQGGREGREGELTQAVGHPGFRAESPLADTLFEGDILLTPNQAKYILLTLKSSIRNAQRNLRLGAKTRVKRKMYRNNDSRWTVFPIEYTYHTDLKEDARKQVKDALDFWQSSTCLSFQRTTRTPGGDYLQFFKGEGCYSMIGRVGGQQGISIGNGCERIGVTSHEIGHALGLWHEQSRPDSDCCIKLIRENIIERMISNFLSRTWTDTEAFGIPYDLGSVMHYGPTAFTKDWSKITIETKVPGFQRTIGQRNFPSFYDVKVINKAYCSNQCSRNHDCQRGGYPHPVNCNKCICPDGLGGDKCERNEAAQSAQCGSVVDLRDGKVREIRSPGYPNPGYDPGMKCSWLFKVPYGRRIVLKFVDNFQFMCMTTCMDYVEIKNGTDLANTGMRFCCYSKPEGLMYSDANEMVIIFKTEVSRDLGFKLRVQMSKKLGVINPSTTPKPDTWVPVIPYTLQSTTTDKPTTTTTATTTTRRATTTPTTTTTRRATTPTTPRRRPPPTTTTNRPTSRRPSTTTIAWWLRTTASTSRPLAGTWSSWTAWGHCSRTCGACGVKTRARICIDEPCDPKLDKEQYRRCNFNVCPGSPKGDYCDRLTAADTPWGSKNSRDSYSFKCKLPSCCPPFKAVGKECRLGLLNDQPVDWRPWSKWGPCIGPECGGCGLSIRKRICNAFQCKGHNIDTRRCNTSPCDSCSPASIRSMVDFPCGAPTQQCTQQRILVKENYVCPCCRPLTLKNGICTL